MLLTNVMNSEEKQPPMGETREDHVKSKMERNPLGFWEISKKLWRENWWYYLILLAAGFFLARGF